jgi:protein SCO1/2
MKKRPDANRRNLLKFLHAALLLCCLAGLAEAQKTQETAGPDHAGHKHAGIPPSSPDGELVSKRVIPDVEVVTQDGKPVKFFTDLVKGKKVMISFIFTSCRLTCPGVGRNFQKLQEEIGEGLGKDIYLITVSTDPVVDTPQVLKTWSEKFHRRKGWTLVTGEKVKMDQLLLTLTGSARQNEGEHTSLLILYDGVTGAWKTNSSLLNPVMLLDELSSLGKTPSN